MGINRDQRCCNRFTFKPHRLVAFLTGIQVIRALWEIWGCVDNKWPPLINTWITPTIYASCLLSVCMMVVSACATWSVYQGHSRSLNINWWLYYALTVLGFINSCANLSIMCIGKDRYIAGCLQQSNETAANELCKDCLVLPGCIRVWEETVVWAAVGSIGTLLLNIAFAYMLYRVKSHQRTYSSASIHPQGQRKTMASPFHHHSHPQPNHPMDEDGFQVIELK
ncbi:hypothetical protein BJV82DRAFT_248622 [Fennellomyces sp. T-0311]|nr:hypothetical protein BJV82DRAFT_248622 [Fennellomyces sp. T-0311]